MDTSTNRTWRSSSYICGMLMLLVLWSNVIGSVPTVDHAKILQEKGYPTETTEQILHATKSRDYFIRHVALTLLTERAAKQAVPTLREALNDPRMEVRSRTAHLLGTLGDKSGLERMRQDLKEYAPDNGTPNPPDPNVTDAWQIEEQKRKRNLNLGYALNAALVLAELGDHRGYELAARMALDGPCSYHRSSAIYVLVEIGKTDQNILASEGVDPGSVLCKMADLEKEQSVFSTLVSYAERLRPDLAERILERTSKSPHQSEKMLRFSAATLKKVRDKSGQIKQQEPNCCDD